jgi:hypothetical protein
MRISNGIGGLSNTADVKSLTSLALTSNCRERQTAMRAAKMTPIDDTARIDE